MHRVIEISDRPVHLSLLRGFCVVKENGEEQARLPLDDMDCLMLTGQTASLTTALLHALMERKIPVAVCGANYHPSGLLLPVIGHGLQKRMLRLQIEATEPFRKRIWQTITMAKVNHQAKVLEDCGTSGLELRSMADRVRSGDPDNIEARAAREYWKLLFDKDFRRHADDGINAALNYGYAVLRAQVARSLVSSGLNPALGLHHENDENPFCLADDIIEPFRPLVDSEVVGLLKDGKIEALIPAHKQALIGVLNQDVKMEGETSTVANAILRSCQSLARAFENSQPVIILPRF